MTKTDKIREASFWFGVSFVVVLVIASFAPSVKSIHDHAVELGFSPVWAICFPVMIDGTMLAAHFLALWLYMSGFPTRRMMATVWVTSFISVFVNLLHAPAGETSLFTLPGVGTEVFTSQLFAMMPPLFLVSMFSLLMYCVELQIGITKKTEEKQARIKRNSEPRKKRNGKVSKQRRREIISDMMRNNEQVATSELAKRFRVTMKTIQQDKKQISLSGN